MVEAVRRGFDATMKDPAFIAEAARASMEIDPLTGEEMQAIRSFQRDLRKHRRPAFEPILAQVRLHLQRLVRAGRELKCVRTDLDEETLVNLLDALDEVFDAKLFAETAPLSPALERKYVRLYVDLTRRLIAPAPPSRKASRS